MEATAFEMTKPQLQAVQDLYRVEGRLPAVRAVRAAMFRAGVDVMDTRATFAPACAIVASLSDLSWRGRDVYGNPIRPV